MKLNRGGVIACSAYIAILALSAGLALAADEKGILILVNFLAILPGLAFLEYSGAAEFVTRMNDGPLLILLSLAIVYLIGWLFSTIRSRLCRWMRGIRL